MATHRERGAIVTPTLQVPPVCYWGRTITVTLTLAALLVTVSVPFSSSLTSAPPSPSTSTRTPSGYMRRSYEISKDSPDLSVVVKTQRYSRGWVLRLGRAGGSENDSVWNVMAGSAAPAGARTNGAWPSTEQVKDV